MCEINWDLTIKAAGFIVVTIGGVVGIVQYLKTQKWKKAEFLAQKHKEFVENLYVQNTMKMLDGFALCLPVNKNEFDGVNEYIEFHRSKLKAALTPAHEKSRPKDQIYIRLCIDKFIFYLGTFQNYIDNEIVDAQHVENLIWYWIKIIGDKNDDTIDSTTKMLLHDYINRHNFDSTKKLLASFNYAIC